MQHTHTPYSTPKYRVNEYNEEWALEKFVRSQKHLDTPAQLFNYVPGGQHTSILAHTHTHNTSHLPETAIPMPEMLWQISIFRSAYK